MTETPKTTVPETNKAATQTPAEGATVQTTSTVPNTDATGKSVPEEYTLEVRVVSGKHAQKDAKGVMTVYKVGDTLRVTRPLYDTFRNKFEPVA